MPAASRYIRESLIETTISRDVLLLSRVDKPALLRRLFELDCANSGQILSFTKMLGQLQDAGNTTTLRARGSSSSSTRIYPEPTGSVETSGGGSLPWAFGQRRDVIALVRNVD